MLSKHGKYIRIQNRLLKYNKILEVNIGISATVNITEKYYIKITYANNQYTAYSRYVHGSNNCTDVNGHRINKLDETIELKYINITDAQKDLELLSNCDINGKF